MPAESSMIRRLRDWKRAERERVNEALPWRAAMLFQWEKLGAHETQSLIQRQNAAAMQANLDALGLRTETKPSPLSSLGSLLG